MSIVPGKPDHQLTITDLARHLCDSAEAAGAGVGASGGALFRFVIVNGAEESLLVGDLPEFDNPDFEAGGNRIIDLVDHPNVDEEPCDCGSPDCVGVQGEEFVVVIARGEGARRMDEAYDRVAAEGTIGPLAALLPPEMLRMISESSTQRVTEALDGEDDPVNGLLDSLGIKVLPSDPVEEEAKKDEEK